MKFIIHITFSCIFYLSSYFVSSQRDFANPAVTDPAPCSCDLRVGSCEPNCCCDSDCDTSDLNVSPVCNGVKTTANYASLTESNFERWNCSNSTSSATYDYFPFVCVQFKMSEVVAQDHPTSSVMFADTIDKAQSLRPSFMSQYAGLFQNLELTATVGTSLNYSVGAPVKQVGNTVFNLPGIVSGSACQNDVTVLFGVNRDVSCPASGTSFTTLCNTIASAVSFLKGGDSSTTVSATFYTQIYNSSTSTATHTGEFYFSSSSTTNINIVSSTNVSIEDYCPGRHPVARTQRYNTACTSASQTLCPSQYQTWSGCKRRSLSYSEIPPTFFSLRNTVTTYDTTDFSDFNNASNISAPTCTGTDYIRRIYYQFSYSSLNNTISAVNVYILTEPSPNVVNRRITIQWVDVASDPSLSTTVPRSYVEGEPLQFFRNGSQSDVAVLIPSSSGLCIDATPQILRYKKSISSNCFIQLMQSTLQQCHDLKLNMYLYLNAYYARASHVLAYPNTNLTATRIPLRDNTQESLDLDRIDETRVNNQLNTSYITSSALSTSVFKIYDAAQTLSICYNVPSGIYIEFGYVRVQISPTVSYERIVSVQFNYTFSNWKFDCNDATCTSTSTQKYPVNFQSFFVDLTSSVLNFTDMTRADMTSADNAIEHLLWLISPEYKGEPGNRKYTIAMILIYIAISVVVLHVLLFGFMCPF